VLLTNNLQSVELEVQADIGQTAQCKVLTDSGQNVMNEVLTDIGETVKYLNKIDSM